MRVERSRNERGWAQWRSFEQSCMCAFLRPLALRTRRCKSHIKIDLDEAHLRPPPAFNNDCFNKKSCVRFFAIRVTVVFSKKLLSLKEYYYFLLSSRICIFHFTLLEEEGSAISILQRSAPHYYQIETAYIYSLITDNNTLEHIVLIYNVR